MAVLTGCASHEPIVCALCLACSNDIAARLSLQIFGVIPVYSHILDELESIHVLLVIVNHVCGHLQRTVHCDVKGQLTGQRRVHVVGVVRVVLVHVHLEDARSVVHRTALQPGEGEDGGVERLAAVGGLILCATGGLVANQVGPCAA